MTTDARTTNRNYPKPHVDNTLSADITRLIQALEAIGVDVAGLLTDVAGRALATHAHAIGDVTGLQAALNAKRDASWVPSLDDLSDVNTAGAANGQFLRLISGFWQPATISVAFSDISGKPSSYPTTWSDVASKPSTFPPSTHSHPISEVAGLQTALDTKLNLGGGTLTGTLFGTIASFSDALYGAAGAAITGTVQATIGDNGNAYQVNNSLGGAISALCPINRGGGNYSLGLYGYGGTFGNNWRLILEHDGSVYFPRTQMNADGSIDIGIRNSGDRTSYIDFHSSGAPETLDYSARIARGAGVDGVLDITNTGAGWIRVLPAANALVQIGVPGANNYLYVPRTDNADEGGEIILGRPSTNTVFTGDVGVDLYCSQARIYDRGGTYRGFVVDFGAIAAGTNVTAAHSGNIGSLVCSGDTQDIGKYIFAYNPSNGANFGGSAPGSGLYPAHHGGWQNGSVNGTWRAQGNGQAGYITLWQRIA